MKTITDDLIEKFIEVGLIKLQSIDQVRSLEMIRAEFKEVEEEVTMSNNKQQIKPFWKGFWMGWMSFYLLLKLIEAL